MKAVSFNKAVKILSKIKNGEVRRMAAKMWFTSNVISRMEEYRKVHYGS